MYQLLRTMRVYVGIVSIQSSSWQLPSKYAKRALESLSPLHDVTEMQCGWSGFTRICFALINAMPSGANTFEGLSRTIQTGVLGITHN